MERIFHAGRILHCRLRFGAGGSAYLYISFCKWAPGNERDRIWEIFKRDTMETEKQYLRYPANDRRKSVCDRRSDYFGGADRYPDIRIYGTLLSEAESLQHAGIIRQSGNGNSILTASLLLGMMILPTIIGVTESAIRAVPPQYYEGSLALGATHERSIFRTVLPAAKSGILAGVVLGIGRAIGETMAVIMVAGNQPRLTGSIFKGVRTLTANIVIEMGYAADLHREALIATGVVLFVFILIINAAVAILKRRADHE